MHVSPSLPSTSPLLSNFSLRPSPSPSCSPSPSLPPPSPPSSQVELTGDATPDMRRLMSADVIIATPEKWDGITRSWHSRSYAQMVWDDMMAGRGAKQVAPPDACM